MRAAALAELVARDLRRSRKNFALAALGLAVGVATLAFFLALSEAMRTVVLGKIFPLDQVEVIPPESSIGSAFTSLLGARPPGIEPAQVDGLRRVPGVRAVLPRMRFAFPTSGRGGRAVFGRDVGAGEIPADGIDPTLVRADLPAGSDFSDPDARSSRRACTQHDGCTGGEFCVFPTIPRAGDPPQQGTCQLPIPVVISPYLLEMFDNVIAPAHRLPRLAAVLARSAQGLVLEWDLGRAGLGAARQGTPRRVYARLVGISRHAMDLGLSVPLEVARRLNREYAGDAAASVYSSVVVYLRDPSELTRVSGAVRAQGLEIRTSGAEQMGLLVTAITVILAFASGVTVLVASLNIAHAFLALLAERRGELALMRALGATRRDIALLVLAQSSAIGVLSSSVGLALAALAAWAANRLAATRLPPFPFKPEVWFAFTPAIVWGVLAFGVGACVLSAIVPALRASRTEPASALSGGV